MPGARPWPLFKKHRGEFMKLLIFRTIVIYLSVLFSMRLMGKRQL